MTIPPIPQLRNQTVYQSLDAAKQALELQKGGAADGVVMAARYKDSGVTKTLLGAFYVSGNTKTVTIFEPTADISSASTAYVDGKIAALDTSVTASDGEHVSVTINEENGIITSVTVSGNDIASAEALSGVNNSLSGVNTSLSGVNNSLTAETANRKAIDGINGNSYTANTGTNYISGATSLNDADKKLDAAISSISSTVTGDRVIQGNGITASPSATGTTVSAKAATNSGSGILNPITVDGDGIKFATYIDAGEY